MQRTVGERFKAEAPGAGPRVSGPVSYVFTCPDGHTQFTVTCPGCDALEPIREEWAKFAGQGGPAKDATSETFEDSRARLGEPRESGGGHALGGFGRHQDKATLRGAMDAERPEVRLGDQVHGPWCELIHEENRWWEVFVAVLNPASRPWLRENADAEIGLTVAVENSAAVADAAIAVAKKLGRL
jgi:hypothetical protein